MDAERKASIRKCLKHGLFHAMPTNANAVVRELLDALDAAEARADEWRTDYIDSVHAMLVAAGAPEDIDAMEAEVRRAGTKPSHYIAQLKAERDRLREALESVEWHEGELGDYCPRCSGYQDEGHTTDCIVGRALNRPECTGGGRS